ncbi:hypothetical protein OEZ86_005233 [Tetradesmus obliquus]|nr:hypothetical protein OEZ86_005233 [Tetradesmus obliquus]
MEQQAKGLAAPLNGALAVDPRMEKSVGPPAAAARPRGPVRRHQPGRGKRLSKQLLQPLQLARRLLRRLQAVPINALQEGRTGSCATLLEGSDAECKRMGYAGSHVRAMHIAFCPSTRDYEVTWAVGCNIRRAGAMSTAARFAARNIEGITCLAQDTAGNVLWGDREGLLGRVPLSNAAHKESDYVADCGITALAVQLDGSCCWVGLESGELLVCRLNDAATAATARLIADQQLLQPPPAAAGPGCAPSSAAAGRVSSILLCQGRAFVAAGDSPATATLQMWHGGSSGSSSESVPQLLDVVSIAECEWLGRSPVTAMTLLYPDSIQPARSLNLGNPAAAAAAAAAAGPNPFSTQAVHAALLPELQHSQAVLPYLVTGHSNGMVVIWVTNSSSSGSSNGLASAAAAAANSSSSSSEDWLTPLLCVMPSSKCGPSVQGWLRGTGLAVRGLGVVEGTGVLCCGHASGKIALHRLTPSAFQRAGAALGLQQQLHRSSSSSSRRRCVPEPEQWWPDSAVLQDAHLTGMEHLLAAPCLVRDGSPSLLLFSAGSSGSVKRWRLRLPQLMQKLGVDGEAFFFDLELFL